MQVSEFSERFLSLSDSVYRLAFYILESEDDARDAVQDLYLKLWSDRDNLDGIASPKAYCLTMIKHLCLDRLRRASHNVRPQGNEPADASDVEERISSTEELRIVEEAMMSLPKRERKVLIYRTVEDLSYDEISRRMSVDKLTLRVLLSNARRKLKKYKSGRK